MKNARLNIVVVAIFAFTLVGGGLGTTRAQSFGDPAFQSTWERTDKPVADGTVKRSFYWGPSPGTQLAEAYAEGAGGQRQVQYFDKSRMEINNPSGNKSDPFYVTNGLLTVELMTGRMQTGNAQFVDRYPAQIPLASDTDDSSAPTYATFGKLLGKAASRIGQAPADRIDKDGKVTPANATTNAEALTIAYYEPVTGHNIPRAFWDFLNASGPVWVGDKLSTARLSDPWFYSSGLPVTETYTAKVKIEGKRDVDVYIQAFERRVLTYVPSFPKEFQVQMGNIGQHYYDWRYKDAGRPTSGPTPTASATQSPGKLTITGTVKSVLTLDIDALKTRKAQSLSVKFADENGTAHTYKGPLVLDLLKEAGGEGNAGRDLPIRYVIATGADGQKAVLSWGEIDPIFAGTKAIVAYEQDGVDLKGEQSPFRLVLPSDKSGARSIYGLTQLEIRAVPPITPTGNTLQITGTLSKSLSLTATDLATRNPVTVQVTYMAGGQVGTHSYKGVPLVQLLNEAGVQTTGDRQSGLLSKYIVATGTGSDRRSAVLSWGEIDPIYAGVNVLVAYEEDGIPLGGGLTRLVVPSDARGGRYIPYLLSLEIKDAGH
ncbi:MAG TPA: molybdopterin-dependent oxidoreductase [Chloroflexia bacterium]|nr:molybdopterin-dependent oxidoreductase [Chloroflexia bacterium]